MIYHRKKSIKAVVIVEFALILPLILGISLCAFEISRAIKLMGVASKLSYEATNVALRKCVDAGNSSSNLPTIDVCLQEVQTGVQNLASVVVPGSRIFLSFYKVNSTRTFWRNNKPLYRIPTPEDPFKATTDRTVAKMIAPATFNELQLHTKIIVGECFLPYEPLFGFVRIFLPFKTIENYMYDATIL